MTQQHPRRHATRREQLYLTAKFRQPNRRTGASSTIRGAGDEPAERPFGMAHLRRAGSAFTVCGTPALTWPIFHHLPVSDAETLCHECVLNTKD
jgi:hypothetical protein